ncbi:hypothetical protein [Gemmata massiliana]|uniref:hypothetical protein n=1 Tax=Gemmata massiliana TaxID=1210884 RepID=UPI0013A6A5EA|nr:hypothetical protein [Gemmata massiliana]
MPLFSVRSFGTEGEIDDSEWSKLYSATSQSFDLPKSGKIAVKVINHFGDEVLKVYPVWSGAKPK